MINRLILFALLVCLIFPATAQELSTDSSKTLPQDTLSEKQSVTAAGDDPTKFLTRVEVFNNVQHYDREQDFYYNVTTMRTIVQFSRHLTTRLDIPLAFNSSQPLPAQKRFGLGDITIRMLGFRIFARKASALSTSLEFSFNTATARGLGTGKNLIIPVVSYTAMIRGKGFFSAVLQQTNSMWGDKERKPVNFTKVQLLLLSLWSAKWWTVLSPEIYLDYVDGTDVSMNLQGRLVYAPVRQVNLWVQASSGLFGNFVGRYQWSAELGFRYFIFWKKQEWGKAATR